MKQGMPGVSAKLVAVLTFLWCGFSLYAPEPEVTTIEGEGVVQRRVSAPERPTEAAVAAARAQRRASAPALTTPAEPQVKPGTEQAPAQPEARGDLEQLQKEAAETRAAEGAVEVAPPGAEAKPAGAPLSKAERETLDFSAFKNQLVTQFGPDLQVPPVTAIQRVAGLGVFAAEEFEDLLLGKEPGTAMAKRFNFMLNDVVEQHADRYVTPQLSAKDIQQYGEQLAQGLATYTQKMRDFKQLADSTGVSFVKESTLPVYPKLSRPLTPAERSAYDVAKASAKDAAKTYDAVAVKALGQMPISFVRGDTPATDQSPLAMLEKQPWVQELPQDVRDVLDPVQGLTWTALRKGRQLAQRFITGEGTRLDPSSYIDPARLWPLATDAYAVQPGQEDAFISTWVAKFADQIKAQQGPTAAAQLPSIPEEGEMPEAQPTPLPAQDVQRLALENLFDRLVKADVILMRDGTVTSPSVTPSAKVLASRQRMETVERIIIALASAHPDVIAKSYFEKLREAILYKNPNTALAVFNVGAKLAATWFSQIDTQVTKILNADQALTAAQPPALTRPLSVRLPEAAPVAKPEAPETAPAPGPEEAAGPGPEETELPGVQEAAAPAAPAGEEEEEVALTLSDRLKQALANARERITSFGRENALKLLLLALAGVGVGLGGWFATMQQKAQDSSSAAATDPTGAQAAANPFSGISDTQAAQVLKRLKKRYATVIPQLKKNLDQASASISANLRSQDAAALTSLAQQVDEDLVLCNEVIEALSAGNELNKWIEFMALLATYQQLIQAAQAARAPSSTLQPSGQGATSLARL